METRRNILQEWAKFSESHLGFENIVRHDLFEDEKTEQIIEKDENDRAHHVNLSTSQSGKFPSHFQETRIQKSAKELVLEDSSGNNNIEKIIKLQRDRTLNEWNDIVTENHPIFSLLKNQLSILKEEHTSITNLIYSKIFHEHIEDPFFVCDLGALLRQHHKFTSNLPRVEPFYAVKCNTDTKLLATLAPLCSGFDCASMGEIQKILSLGVTANRIIYANPCKPISHIRYATTVGVDLMTFDNLDELKKVSRVNPSARMVLRILADDSKSICAFGEKFGCSVKQSLSLLRKARRLGVNVVGVSFHVGSGCTDATVYDDAIYRAKIVFSYGKQVGYNFNFLDLGGGYPGMENNLPDSCEVKKTIINNMMISSIDDSIRAKDTPKNYDNNIELNQNETSNCDGISNTIDGKDKYVISDPSFKNVEETISYQNNNTIDYSTLNIEFENIARTIRLALQKYFPQSEYTDLKIIAEPGRFYAAPAFTLVTNVTSRRVLTKTRKQDAKLDENGLPKFDVDTDYSKCQERNLSFKTEEEEEESDDDNDHDNENETNYLDPNQTSFMYYINDGVYGSFNCILFDHAYCRPNVLVCNGKFIYKKCLKDDVNFIEGKAPESFTEILDGERSYQCSIWGPTCDSMDCINKEAYLPKLEVGDWLFFRSMGAYTCAASSNFNGFEPPQIFYTNTFNLKN